MVLGCARDFKIQTWRFQGFPFHLKWRREGLDVDSYALP